MNKYKPADFAPNYGIFFFVARIERARRKKIEKITLWVKANPALGLSVSLQDLVENEFAAITTHKFEAEFKAKRLGIWSNFGWHTLTLVKFRMFK